MTHAVILFGRTVSHCIQHSTSCCSVSLNQLYSSTKWTKQVLRGVLSSLTSHFVNPHSVGQGLILPNTSLDEASGTGWYSITVQQHSGVQWGGRGRVDSPFVTAEFQLIFHWIKKKETFLMLPVCVQYLNEENGASKRKISNKPVTKYRPVN